MDMNRRGFLKAVLACAVAPAIVKAEVLMPVRKLAVVDHASILRSGVVGRIEAFSIYDSEVWSAALCRKFYSTHVFGEITETSLEAEIEKAGDLIVIQRNPMIELLRQRV